MMCYFINITKGSVGILCKSGPMKEQFPNQHPSDIIVAFLKSNAVHA